MEWVIGRVLTRRLLESVAVVGVAIGSLSGCVVLTPTPTPEPTSEQVITIPGDEWDLQRVGAVSLVTPADPVVGVQSLLHGTLAVTDDGCLGLETESEIIPMVFPVGTTLIDSQHIESDGVVRALGTEVSLGGGRVLGNELPSPCASDEVFILANVITDPVE